jgi:two-component system chemotaxis response regulator CheB
VQDPSDALYPWMPQAAAARVTPDHVVPAAKLGALIAEITAMEMARPAAAGHADPLLDAEVAMSGLAPVTTDALATPAAGYGCPSCGGSLFEIEDRPLPRYRCRVGHAWSPESLLDEQAVALEGALWIALRALEEKSALTRRMASADRPYHSSSGARFQHMADDAEAAGAVIRELIGRLGATVPGSAPEVR